MYEDSSENLSEFLAVVVPPPPSMASKCGKMIRKGSWSCEMRKLKTEVAAMEAVHERGLHECEMTHLYV